MREYNVYEPSEEENWFLEAFDHAKRLAALGKWQEAQNMASWWSEGVCDTLRIVNTGNWKFFKRNLVAKWFGKAKSKRFYATWNVDEALNYAQSFWDRSVRFSLFPKDIACHATSYQLPKEKRDTWATVLESVDRTTDIEMFPEATTETSICFRRYTSCWGENVTYESGEGQAMYVFEQERGKHSVVSASKFARNSDYDFICSEVNQAQSTKKIQRALEGLITSFDKEISSKCFGACRKLGIEHLSLEGYYDPARPDSYLVVDFDLPFDIFFM